MFSEKGISRFFVYFSIVVFTFVLILFLFTNNFIWLLLILGFTLFISKFSFKRFWLLLLVISLIIRFVFILSADFPQVYDFETLLEASKMFAVGDYSFSSWWHFHTWGYQTGFVIYQGFLLKLFNSVFFLKFLNILYSCCLVLVIYFVGKKVSSERAARVVSLLYMIFPFPLFLNSILANHHLSCLLMYLGILFLIRKDRKFIDYVFAGIFISLGNIIRPEGIIVVVSLLIYELFVFDKSRVFNILVRVSSFLIVYFFIGYMASFMVIKSGVNSSGLKNNDPLWKFVLGFNYDTCGYYDDADSVYQVDRDTEIAIIKERAFSDLGRTGKLMLCKIDRFWLSSGLDAESGSFSDKVFKVGSFSIQFSTLEGIAIDVNSYIYLTVFIMFFVGLFVNRKSLSNESLFFLIMIVVTFFVFLLIEIQPRYAYFVHISLFILASLGFDFVIDKLSNVKFLKKIF